MSTDSSTHLPFSVALAQSYPASAEAGQLTAHHLTMAVHGGIGGGGGAANEQGGARGTGQGPSIQVFTQSMVLGQQQTLADEALSVNINCPPPSKYFEGRKEILDQLNQCFEANSLNEQIVVLLHGLVPLKDL
ncbi:hypothetical protein HMN09_00302400 [Mycena chlorophos]|uniref:Uncharacterized protein n=1 Tax=Mycena chlorophos TaxID=658473 RepID=A0A8H6TL80_MYCCL|nr:hypothetical protein HMN09_00302400 [Mycena chlorophos]